MRTSVESIWISEYENEEDICGTLIVIGVDNSLASLTSVVIGKKERTLIEPADDSIRIFALETVWDWIDNDKKKIKKIHLTRSVFFFYLCAIVLQ